MSPKAALIMAAGRGTRMRSKLNKVLHPVAGRPMIHAPVELALSLGAEKIVVILGHQREAVEAELHAAFPEAPIHIAVQEQQLGTAHAVLCGAEALAGFHGQILILSGDVPCLRLEQLKALEKVTGEAALGVMGMRLEIPAVYGRLIRDETGSLVVIREARDCRPEQLKIQEVNAGIYCAQASFLFEGLKRLGQENAQGEYYLTDLVAEARSAGLELRDLVLGDQAALELRGINDRLDLAQAEAMIQARLAEELMQSGVSIQDPRRLRLEWGVRVEPDTIIGPDVALLGETRVGRGCVLGQGVWLKDTEVGEGSQIHPYSLAERAQIGPACAVGPFARLREGTILKREVRVGNFVETKKAQLDEGVKASHLSYLGDTHIGAGSNIGAGTITCNYDGVHKHHTEIGAGAFIGSDSQLVAPVEVGEGAYVGAGSTITEDIPKDALALSRMRQKNIEGWAAQRRALLKKEKI